MCYFYREFLLYSIELSGIEMELLPLLKKLIQHTLQTLFSHLFYDADFWMRQSLKVLNLTGELFLRVSSFKIRILIRPVSATHFYNKVITTTTLVTMK